MEYKILFKCHPQKVNDLANVFSGLERKGKIRIWSVDYRQGIMITDNIKTVEQCIAIGATVGKYEPVFYKGVEVIK